MADDPKQTGPHDARRVDVSQDHELRYWSDRFGVSPAQLKRVVHRVGPIAEDVERTISGARTST